MVSYEYDSGLPVTEYANGIPMVTGVRYQASGAVSSYTTGVNTGKNVTTTVVQDASLLARPSQIYATAQATQVRLFDTLGYVYDGGGNINSIGLDTFVYDNRSRLTSSFYSGLTTQGYSYDRYGNLLSKGSTTYSVSTATNRLTTSTYDSRGNVTVNAGETYSYDGLDRQTTHTAAGSTWSYLYDGSNERIVKAPPAGGTWTYTLRDEGNRVATEYSGLTQSRDNVFLGNLAVVSYANSAVGGNGPVWTFYGSDHLGTPRLVTDIAGNTVETRKSWPYGEDTTAPGTFQRLRFALMERDTEASRYYDHARSHEFGLGRFLSPDSVGGRLFDPQSWNRYAYARNNPLKFVDPNGKEIRLAGDVAKALGDIRQLVPAGDRSSLKTRSEGGTVRIDATALAAHESRSGNFAMLTRLATNTQVVEVDTSSRHVETTSNEIKTVGNFTAPADYKNPEGLVGITLGPNESQSGNIHVQVNPFLSGIQTAGTLGHELVHADFEMRGLDEKHSKNMGKPNQALESAIRRAFDEAMRNFDPFMAR